MTIDFKKLCTPKEAAEILGIHESLVCRYCKSKRIPARQIGGTWVMDRSDVEKFRDRPRPAGNPNFLRRNSKKKKKI